MKFDAEPLKFTKYTTECALGLILERVLQFPAVWGETSLVLPKAAAAVSIAAKSEYDPVAHSKTKVAWD